MREEARRESASRASSRGANPQGDYYIDGNTIRRVETAPDYQRALRERKEREREEQERLRRRAIRRNQERALRMSRSYIVFLTMAVLVFGTFASVFIQLQSDVTARMKRIASLESQIADLQADNDEAYKRIATNVDLDAIKSAAIGELGMDYARESQIVYYTVGEDDYMNYYGEESEGR